MSHLCPLVPPSLPRSSRQRLLVLYLLAAGSVAAQTPPPDAPLAPIVRELQRQEERDRVLRERSDQEPDVHLPASLHMAPDTGLPEGEGPCMRIDRIELEGERAADFAWVVDAASRRADGAADPVAGRCLGTQGIDLVMRRLQNALVARGFVTTRVLAPPQDLGTGTLRLALVAGRVRTIRFTPDSGGRASAAKVASAVPLSPGDLLNLRDIEQALENFRRVPTVDAAIDIVPAEPAEGEVPAAAGDSDLVIRWHPSAPARVLISVDDSGTRATGKRQGAATLLLDDPLGLNDLLSFTLQHDLGGGEAGDRGTRGRSFSYSVPWGYWLLGVNGGRSRYHQTVAGATQNYVYSGTSSQGDLRVSRVVYRDAWRKTVLSLRGWMRSSHNFIEDTEVEVQRRRTAGWELAAQHREARQGAALDLGLAWRRGTGAWGAQPAPEEDQGEGDSRAGILALDAAVQAPFTAAGQRLRWSSAARAQWSRKPLVPQDRFAIGGRYTVRGFDGESVLSAQRGWLLRNELGWSLEAGGVEVFAGLDHGEVGGAGAQQLLGRRLTGAVLGLRGAAGPFSYELFCGAPVRKPEGFQASRHVTGFSLAATF